MKFTIVVDRLLNKTDRVKIIIFNCDDKFTI